MHSRIFQITKEQIAEENYLNEDTLEQGDTVAIDYCANIGNIDRENSIACLVDDVLPNGMFTRLGANILRYNGGMEQWKADTVAEIQKRAAALTTDSFFYGCRLYDLKESVVNPLDTSFLFYMDAEGLENTASRSLDFMSYVNGLEEGTLLYIGGVIDYHF